MNMSLFQKTARVIARNTQIPNAQTAFGGTFGVAIDRSSVLEKVTLTLTASATFATAPTSAAVVAAGAKHLIVALSLRTSDGEIISAISGAQLSDFIDMLQYQTTPVTVIGANGGVSSVTYQVEVPFAMLDAHLDFHSALRGGGTSKLDLAVQIANQVRALAMVFGGSATPTLINVSCDIELNQYPEMAHDDRIAKSVQFLAAKQQAVGAGSGGTYTVQLDPDDATRIITIHTFDTTAGADAGVLADTVITNVKLVQGNKTLRDQSWGALRFAAQKIRQHSAVGFGLLDWGNDVASFALLSKEPIFLQLTIPATTPAARIEVLQNYIKPRAGA